MDLRSLTKQSGFTAVENSLFRRTKDFGGPACAYLYCYYVCRAGSSDEVVVSLEEIESELGLSAPTIRKYNDLLVQAGLLEVVKNRPSSGKWAYNSYRVLYVDRSKNSSPGTTDDAPASAATGEENLPLLIDVEDRGTHRTIDTSSQSSTEPPGQPERPAAGASPVDTLRKLGLDYSAVARSAGDSAGSQHRRPPVGNGKNHHEQYLSKKSGERWSEFNSVDLCYLFADGYANAYGRPHPKINFARDGAFMKKYLLDVFGPEESIDMVVALFKHRAAFETHQYPTVSMACFTWCTGKLQQLRAKSGEKVTQRPVDPAVEAKRQQKMKEWGLTD